MLKRFETYALAIVCLMCLCVIGLMSLAAGELGRRPNNPDPVVVNLIDTLCSADYTQSEGLYLFANSFCELSDQVGRELTVMDDLSSVQDTFESKVIGLNFDIASVEYDSLGHDGIKITRLDSTGDKVLPILGLWYTVRDGKIATWRLANLIPFSRYDEEHPDAYG